VRQFPAQRYEMDSLGLGLMGVLANPEHERFCQLAHKRIWSGEKRASACHAVYVEVIYEGEEPDSEATHANVRKFYNRADIKRRMQESRKWPIMRQNSPESTQAGRN
jgi:hypothetical protein